MFELDTPQDDGLYIPTVGDWSRDKHWFLTRYIDAFTTSMKDKQWQGLHYIDLFAGAGIERLKTSEELHWGSPLIAAQSTHPFTGLHLCEKNKRKHSALKSRIEKFRADAQVLHGDANKQIAEIVKTIPSGSLSLAFLDPYGLHLEYDTLKVLSEIRCDLIILFPDRVDALRNWEKNYLHNPNSNLDRCLGTGSDWRSILNKTPHDRLCETLRDLYIEQIRDLGYNEIEFERIEANKHPLYVLILCSRHHLASELWRGISSKKRDGQRTLPFD